MNYKILRYDCVESTNTLAKALAKEGACEGTVIIANKQTMGRGRLGKSFFSPSETGLYMSIILRPSLPPEKAVEITSLAAVALLRTVKKLSDGDFKIKWVNDIYKNGKKVCGILTESSITASGLEYAVLGIGVNLFAPQGGFPDEIKNIADSVFECTFNKAKKEEFTTLLLDEISLLYNDIGKNRYVDEYRENSYITGKKIFVLKGDEKIPARACEILDDYSLSVTLESGEKAVLSSGDISIRV